MISRRAFLRSAFVGGSVVGVGLAANDLRPDGPTSEFITEHVTVKLSDLPPAFDGYRIGFLTDLHIGIWVPEEWIHKALSVLTASDIDILILGGDYILVNESTAWQDYGIVRNERYASLNKPDAIPAIYSSFGKCFQGYHFRDGIIAVVGNHDHWNSFPTFQRILKAFPEIHILINQEVSISRGEQRLRFFGVDDYLTGLPIPPPRLTQPREISSRVLISHNPDYIPALLARPEHDFSLALCGHTHGGQIVLPLLGPVAAQVVDQRFVAGMQTIGNKMIYTSRGLGVVGLPFRVNCPPEVTIFALQRT